MSNYKSELENAYSKSTLKAVHSRMRKIFKLMKIEDEDINKVIVNDCKDLIDAVDTLPEISRHPLLFQVLAICRIMKLKQSKTLLKKATIYKETSKKRLLEQHKTRSSNTDLDITKIQKYYYDRFHTAKTKTKLASARLVLFTILNNTPIRLTEICNIKYEDDNIHNHVNLDNGRITIRMHKNSKKGGKTRKIKLSQEEIDIIKCHKKILQTEFLIPKLKGDHSKNDTNGIEGLYRNSIKNYCKVHDIDYKKNAFGIHMLRSIEQTKNIKNKITLNCSVEELENILKRCNELGHDMGTMLQYYCNKD